MRTFQDARHCKIVPSKNKAQDYSAHSVKLEVDRACFHTLIHTEEASAK